MHRILLFLMLVWATPLFAQEQDTTRLPTGVRLGMIYQTLQRPSLAVRPFTGDEMLEAEALEIGSIIQRDLDYSDRFDIFLTPPQLSTGPVDYAAWDGLGVVYVVSGHVESGEDGPLVRISLHDVVYGTVRNVQAFRLPEPGAEEFRMAVHAVADEIVRWVTGQPGQAASRIAFVRTSASGAYELMVVDSDGENLRRVAVSEYMIYSPAWSPDGRRIVYTITFPNGEYHVVERDVASGEDRTILAGPGLRMTPTYSPDGEQLALAVENGREVDLFLYNLRDACCLRRLLGGPWADISPTFSPDGRRLAFMSDRLGQPHIYVVSIDGGEPELLSPYVYGEPGYYTSPDWSPETSLVAFHGRSRGQHQIMVADAARPGRTVQQVTEEGVSEDPSWAPDGRHIAFSGVRAGGRGLYVIDAVSGRTRPLVLGGRVRMPDWSPALIRASALTVRGE